VTGKAKRRAPLRPAGLRWRSLARAGARHQGHRGLLRAGRERPRHCRAADQRDERAPFHCSVLPMLQTKIAQHCCAAGFQFGLCRLWVIRDRGRQSQRPMHVRFHPRKRTNKQTSRDVRFVPKAAVSNRSKEQAIRSPRRRGRAGRRRIEAERLRNQIDNIVRQPRQPLAAALRTSDRLTAALALLKAAFAPADSVGAGVGHAQSPRIRGSAASGLGRSCLVQSELGYVC
jgi:hypothetical protein